MDYDDRVAAVAREAALLADALRAAPLTAPVPTCPDWTLRDLAAHVGEFVGLWTHVLCEAGRVAKSPFTPLADVDADAGSWFEQLAAEGPQVTHEHLPADLTLTGSASDLALLLFRRPTIGAVERAGDPAALDAWYRDFLFD